jgi:diamine N-acetyltransferase
MIAVIKAGTEHIAMIQNLANITWPVTYGDILTPAQLDYMMELMYSKAALQKQMQSGQQFILAQEQDKFVAFASYSLQPGSNPVVCKLNKIYILPNQQGKGIGKLLINYITTDIKGADTLQLNVNKHNRALHFYEKLGFKIVAEEIIDIGQGFYMDDYVMALKLTV